MASRCNILGCVALLLVSCGGNAIRPFPAQAPFARDTDLNSVRVACHEAPSKKDPAHVSCAPAEYVSPLAWDGMDNSIFRPFSEVFAVKKSKEAVNANSLDEVADSAWFTNRIGVKPFSEDELRLGACRSEQYLDGTSAADGEWLIDKGKGNGASLGFRVNIKGKGKYLFKADIPTQPERPSAASVIGAAAYHAAGFFTSCEQVVFFKPSVLKLAPGLTYEDNSGIERRFDQRALERVLASATKRGDYIRMQASAWLPGALLGPFRYEGMRDDDPNDVIPHQDRRELRGGRLLAAWLDHFDAREQNTMDSWIANDKKVPDSSPGYVRHYYLDTSDCLGSDWAWDGISRRLGRSYLLDWGDIGHDFITLGIQVRSWEKLERVPGFEMFGYFDAEHFVAEEWKNEYPNPAFSNMTERDGAWMARILARFTPESVATLAELGRFADPKTTHYLAGVLEGRLERVLSRYLTRLSPLSDVRVSDRQLCAVDLARWRSVTSSAPVSYSVSSSDHERLALTAGPDGQVCVTLPSNSATAVRPPRFTVSISNGIAGPLLVQLYDLGNERGYAIAGLERPEAS